MLNVLSAFTLFWTIGMFAIAIFASLEYLRIVVTRRQLEKHLQLARETFEEIKMQDQKCASIMGEICKLQQELQQQQAARVVRGGES